MIPKKGVKSANESVVKIVLTLIPKQFTRTNLSHFFNCRPISIFETYVPSPLPNIQSLDEVVTEHTSIVFSSVAGGIVTLNGITIRWWKVARHFGIRILRVMIFYRIKQEFQR